MKQLVKKNQFIITALAIMIAIAGYLSYAQRTGEDNQYLAVNNMEKENGINLNDISEEDILAENMALKEAQNTEETTASGNEEESKEDVLMEIDSLDVDLENTGVTDNPGDAVLTSGTNS